jgi:hypothetical protein
MCCLQNLKINPKARSVPIISVMELLEYVMSGVCVFLHSSRIMKTPSLAFMVPVYRRKGLAIMAAWNGPVLIKRP